jgi:hypothetical protein
MSAGDYISLKKSKLLKNYAPITSYGNKTIDNYDNYVRKLALNTVIDSCSKDFYGDDEEKAINNILINCTNYPENSFDGVIHSKPIILIPNNNVGLDWKSYDGSMLSYQNSSYPYGTVTIHPNFFSTAGPKVGAQGQSSGIITNITDLSFGTNGNFLGYPNVADQTDDYDRYPVVIEWTGYFFCTETGNWTFNLSTLGKDYSFFWLGPTAKSGYFWNDTSNNAFISHQYNGYANSSDIDLNSNIIHMTVNTYYKMRIQYNQPSSYQYLSLSFTDPNGNTTFDGTKNYFRENYMRYELDQIPLQSTPSVPTKLQQPCYRGEQPCTTFIHSKRASHISNVHRRQWNLKKKEMLSITDSTTYKM